MALEWPDVEKEQKKKLAAKKKKQDFIVSDSDGDFQPKKGRKEAGLLFQVGVCFVCPVFDSIRW